MKSLAVLATVSLTSAQSIVSSDIFTITQSETFAPEILLDVHLNNTAIASEVFQHGCYCSKLYNLNEKSIRGGSTVVDDFDDICRSWSRCRECNDKHLGGSCRDGNVNPKDTQYEYVVTQNLYDDGVIVYDCSANVETCAYDSCLIDVEYINQISTYLGQFTVATPFVATGIDDTTCTHLNEPYQERTCNGTAPDLYTIKVETRVVATAEEVLEEFSDVLSDQIVDDAVTAEGIACPDGTCGCAGGNAVANVLFFRTTTSTSWFAGKALCESMGMTLAEPRTAAENNLLTTGAPDSYIGGRRQPYDPVTQQWDRYHSTYNTWVWDTDGTPISPTHWNGGEPNNSGGYEPCLQMYTSGRWNDLGCNYNLQIVCQQRTCNGDE